MVEQLLPGSYAWRELDNVHKEAVIISFHAEMLKVGFAFSKEQVRDIFMQSRPAIIVNDKNEYGTDGRSRAALDFFISLEFNKKNSK